MFCLQVNLFGEDFDFYVIVFLYSWWSAGSAFLNNKQFMF